MRETERIASELRRAYDGDPWHGPPMVKILEGLTAEQAAWPPLEGAHSIWETLLHVIAWMRETLRRVEGAEPAEPPGGDWPALEARHPEAWDRTLADLSRVHEELEAKIVRFPEERLEEIVGRHDRDRALGTGVSFYVLLHGIVQHNVYHSAQIATLRRALASGRWEA